MKKQKSSTQIPDPGFFDHQILDRLPDIVVTVNFIGIVTYANPAFEKISGYPLNVIENKHFTKLPFFRTEDLPRFLKIFAAIIKKKKHDPFEIEWVHHDGSARFSEVRVIKPQKGAVVKEFLTMARERTQEVLATRKLAKTLALLEKSQQMGKIGSWELDVETNETKWTAELFNIYGFKKDVKPSLEKFKALVHPDDLKSVLAFWEGHLMLKPFENDFRLIINGKTKWIHAYTETLYDQRGKAIKVFGTEQDISLQKKIENNYLNLVNEIKEGFFMGNEAGEITFANKAMSEIFGYQSPDEMEGIPFWTNIPAEAQEKFRSLYAGFVAEKKFPPEIEMPIVRVDGSPRLILLRISPVLEHEKYMGTTGFIRDITELNKVETNLINKTRELENFNNTLVDREIRMIELKEEINYLCQEQHKPIRYPTVWENGEG